MLALGLPNRAIAERLVTSEATIKSHVHHLIDKLGVSSRAEVLVRARELGDSTRSVVQAAQAEQLQGLVTDTRQDAVQRGLVDDEAAEDRLTPARGLDGQVAEPRGPGWVDATPRVGSRTSGMPQDYPPVELPVVHQKVELERRHGSARGPARPRA